MNCPAARQRPDREDGVTLLELVVALAIVGLLALLAQAAWRDHAQRVRRSDATMALLTLASAQEAFYLEVGRYASDVSRPPPEGLGLSGTEHGWYRLEIDNAGIDRYTAIATPPPDSPQTGDARCQRFGIDQTGARSASPGPPEECWR